jgi:hypothetical protein
MCRGKPVKKTRADIAAGGFEGPELDLFELASSPSQGSRRECRQPSIDPWLIGATHSHTPSHSVTFGHALVRRPTISLLLNRKIL